MPTAKEKIRAGVDEIDAAKSQKPMALAGLRTAPKSLSEVKTRVAKVMALRDRLRASENDLAATIATERATTKDRLHDQGRIRDGRIITDTWNDSGRNAALTQHITKFAKALRAQHAPERKEIIAEVKAHGAALDLVKSLWTSPVARLHLDTVGDPKRVQFAAAMQHTGPMGIEDTVKAAITTGNKALLAAAHDCIEGLSSSSKKMVRVSRHQAAAVLLGDEFLDAVEFLGTAEIAIEEAQISFLVSEGRKPSAQDTIKLARMRQDLETKLNRPLTEPNEDDGGDDNNAGDDGDKKPDILETSKTASRLFAEGKDAEAYQVLREAGLLIEKGDQGNDD